MTSLTLFEPRFAGDSPYYDPVVDGELKRVARSFQDNWSASRILIVKEKGDIECRVENTFWHWISYLFTWWLPFLFCFYSQSFADDNRRTIDYFLDTFGKERMERISERYGLNLFERRRRGDSLTKGDLEAIFLGIADVRFADFETLFGQIKGGDPSIGSLSKELSQSLRDEFQDKTSLRDLSKRDIDVLWGILAPFSRMQTIFCNRAYKSFFGTAQGGTFNAIRNRVRYIEEMRRTDFFNVDDVVKRSGLRGDDATQEIQDRWTTRLIKKIVDDYLPEGVVIPHEKGYHYHYKMINKQGTFKLLLKPVNRHPELRPTIAYLSTRASGFYSLFNAEHWRSRCELLCSDVGVFGTIATYEETKKVLTDPEEGFIEKPGEQVDLIGYSLGGKHAQNDLALFYPLVHSMTGVCNPASTAAVADWFAERMGSDACKYLEINPLHIRYLRHSRDAVADLQDVHLGVDSPSDRVHLSLAIYDELVDDEPFPKEGSMPKLVDPSRTAVSAVWDMLFASIFDTHTRETGLYGRFAKWSFSNQVIGAKAKEELENLNIYLRNVDHKSAEWEVWRTILTTFWQSPDFIEFLEKHPIVVSNLQLKENNVAA